MADQTPIDDYGAADPRHRTPATMTRSMADFLHDVTQLVELQARLLAVDLRESTSRMIWAAGLAGFGAALLLGCFPVLLLGIAYALVTQAGLSYAAACVWTAIGGAILALLVIGIAWLVFRRNLSIVERSRDELRRNVDWIRTALKERGHPGATPAP